MCKEAVCNMFGFCWRESWKLAHLTSYLENAVVPDILSECQPASRNHGAACDRVCVKIGTWTKVGGFLVGFLSIEGLDPHPRAFLLGEPAKSRGCESNVLVQNQAPNVGDFPLNFL